MSERQKYMAKRLVEILDALGSIKYFTSSFGYPKASIEVIGADLFKKPKDDKEAKQVMMEKLAQVFTEAIGIFESEEIEKEMKKLKQHSEKTK